MIGSIEIENLILGAILLESECLPLVLGICKKEYFYLRQNMIVYQAIETLYNSKCAVDIMTVTQEVKQMGRLEDIGGAYYISSLTNRIASSMNIESHIKILHQFYILRQLNILGHKLISGTEAQNADAFEVIEKITETITELTSFTTKKFRRVGDIFNQMINEINEVIEKGLPTGIMTNLRNLDNQTGGWQNGDLIVIAARPGMGKTAIALQFAKFPAYNQNSPVAIFSLEMQDTQLVGRLAASDSDISSTKINQKKVNRYELSSIGAACKKLIDAPIFIDDTPGLSLAELRIRAITLHREQKLKLIIADYLQLMSGDERQREQEVAMISRGLKGLAKELNIPVIALSQLSRKVEERADKRPMLSDLRESGAIEQDADMVCFLFRPEYYDMYQNGYEYGTTSLETKNLMLFDIAKGRGIHICEVPLKFYGEFMKVENYDLP